MGQTGKGPVLIQLEKSGDEIQLGRDRLRAVALHQVIEHLFNVVAAQFRHFDPLASLEPRRMPGIEIRADVVMEPVKSRDAK